MTPEKSKPTPADLREAEPQAQMRTEDSAELAAVENNTSVAAAWRQAAVDDLAKRLRHEIWHIAHQDYDPVSVMVTDQLIDQLVGWAPTLSRLSQMRTLADYRPQHDEECAARCCLVCGWAHENGHHPECVADEAQPRACSCGLDALLSRLSPSAGEQEMTKKDQGAELRGKMAERSSADNT